MEIRPRISKTGELLICKSHVVQVDCFGIPYRFNTTSKLRLTLPNSLRVLQVKPCEHDTLLSSCENARAKLMLCRLFHHGHVGEVDCKLCTDVPRQCSKCHTVWDIEPAHTFHNSKHTVITILTWRNLGSCVSVYDKKWCCHIRPMFPADRHILHNSVRDEPCPRQQFEELDNPAALDSEPASKQNLATHMRWDAFHGGNCSILLTPDAHYCDQSRKQIISLSIVNIWFLHSISLLIILLFSTHIWFKWFVLWLLVPRFLSSWSLFLSLS